MVEKVDEIGEIHRQICSPEKDKILCSMNEEKLELMKNKQPGHDFKKVINFDAGGRERGEASVLGGFIMWLARL